MKDEEEISRMLASLKTVDAPENFEGGVHSRIAQHRDERSLSRPSLLLAAKFALPLGLLLAAGGFLIVSNDGTLNTDLVPPVDDPTHNIAVVDDPQATQSNTSTTINENSQIAQVPVNRVGGNTRTVPQGGSEDIGLSSDDSTLFPDGVDPRKAKVVNGKPPTGGAISPASVLSMIGISSSCSSKGCVATAVREGSIAATAGIENGDLISEIDGRPINANGISGPFSVSEITLVRAGKKMTVSIARR
ncbi:MAG: PDZ domain-containing protein [Pyrinomonadaceae bacterium]